MSTTDGFSRVSRETTRRRVKFHAGVEDLEGRQLLSGAHHQGFHHVAVHRQPPVHTASIQQTQTGTQTSNHASARHTQTASHGQAAHGRAAHGRAMKISGISKAISAPMITVQPIINEIGRAHV